MNIRYLTLLFFLGVVMVPEVGLCATQNAQALPLTGNAPAIKVQITNAENTITLNYTVPEVSLVSLNEQGTFPKGTYHKTRVIAGNAEKMAREGEPVLPMVPSIVAIPAGKAIGSIQVARSGTVYYGGTYFVEYGEKTIPISCTDCDKGAAGNPAIYASDSAYPYANYELVTVQKKCGVSFVYINSYPVTYYPLSGRIESYRTISVTVSLVSETGQADRGVAIRPERIDAKSMGIENPEALKTYTADYCRQINENLQTTGIYNPAETYRYVIITTTALRDAATALPKLSDFIDWRSGTLGGSLSVKVVTTDGANGIYNNYVGSEVPDDPIDKIRSFIRYAYNNWGTEYVLIIGDPNDNSTNCIVPMRRLYGHIDNPSATDSLYSDIYLQCLDGPFNYNQNNDWGEKTDGSSGGDVDLMAEVFIGRVFAENANEMSHFIYKTIEYEKKAFVENDPYVDNGLILGDYLATTPNGTNVYATPSCERVRRGEPDPKTYGFTSSPYYLNAETWYDPGFAWSAQHVIDKFKSNSTGMIHHFGHENYLTLMKCSMGNQEEFTNTKYPFLYSLGCDVGLPKGICAGEYITTGKDDATINGVWGAVLNTHHGLFSYNIQTLDVFGASPDFSIKFWNAYFYKGLLNLGAMVTASHEENLSKINDNSYRWVYFCNTTFGDPFARFKDPVLCERNLTDGQLTGYQDVLARKLLVGGGTTGTFSVESGAEILFSSGREIRLVPNCHIKPGANFKAHIDPSLYKSSCN